MGLLDDAISVVGKLAGGQQNNWIEQAISVIDHPQIGGLSGLIDKFKTNGLGEIVSSWIGTGSNLPISAEQIGQVLGKENISSIAGTLGVSDQELSDRLAGLLPQLIDRLTPDGRVPDNHALGASLASLAEKFLRG
jgi:uncharacterized protein YidB (DUF937 family)